MAGGSTSGKAVMVARARRRAALHGNSSNTVCLYSIEPMQAKLDKCAFTAFQESFCAAATFRAGRLQTNVKRHCEVAGSTEQCAAMKRNTRECVHLLIEGMQRHGLCAATRWPRRAG
jgi:hypothetical protein